MEIGLQILFGGRRQSGQSPSVGRLTAASFATKAGGQSLSLVGLKLNWYSFQAIGLFLIILRYKLLRPKFEFDGSEIELNHFKLLD